jgi:hypothetical protein
MYCCAICWANLEAGMSPGRRARRHVGRCIRP